MSLRFSQVEFQGHVYTLTVHSVSGAPNVSVWTVDSKRSDLDAVPCQVQRSLLKGINDAEPVVTQFKWMNTGGNGRARAVWVASEGKLLGEGQKAVEILEMSYRCLVNTWQDGKRVEEEIPFATLEAAKEYGNRYLEGAK